MLNVLKLERKLLKHEVGVTKTKTLENEDLRPKTRLSVPT